MLARSAVFILVLALITVVLIDEAVAWRGGGRGGRGWGGRSWGGRGWGGRGWGRGWGGGWGGYYGGYYPGCSWLYGMCYPY